MTELTAIAVTLSPIVSDLIGSLLAARMPLALAGRFETRHAAETWLGLHTAELILLGAEAGAADKLIDRFLALAPGAAVLALSGDGHSVRLHAHGADERRLYDPSPGQLAEAVLEIIGAGRRGAAAI